MKKLIFSIEIIFVLIPAILFMLAMLGWLLAVYSLHDSPKLTVTLLYLGGWTGILALVQMIFPIWLEKNYKNRFISLMLLIGCIAAAYPIYFVYSAPYIGGKRAPFLLFLFPIIVGIHWLYEYKKLIAEQNKTQLQKP